MLLLQESVKCQARASYPNNQQLGEFGGFKFSVPHYAHLRNGGAHSNCPVCSCKEHMISIQIQCLEYTRLLQHRPFHRLEPGCLPVYSHIILIISPILVLRFFYLLLCDYMSGIFFFPKKLLSFLFSLSHNFVLIVL